jgi:hypothetical protein
MIIIILIQIWHYQIDQTLDGLNLDWLIFCGSWWRVDVYLQYAYHLPTDHRRRRSRRDFIPRRDRGSAAASSPLYGGPEASDPRRTSRPAAPLPPRSVHLLRYGPLLSVVQFPSQWGPPLTIQSAPVSRLHPWAPEKGVCLPPPTALKRPDRLVLGPAAGQGRPDRLQCQG